MIDMLGNTINYDYTLIDNGLFQTNVNSLATGVYFIKILGDGYEHIQKIVKQ